MVVTSLAVALGLFLLPRIRQQQKIKRLEALGGYVSYLSDAMDGQPNGPAWLRSIFGDHFFSSPRQVIFYSKCKNPSEALRISAGLSGLIAVEISGPVDLSAPLPQSADFRSLAANFHGPFLTLRNIPITDEDAAAIGGIKSLTQLQLNHCDITRHGLSQLLQISNLEFLDLAQNEQIDDDSLECVGRVESLLGLSLAGTGVKGDGLRYLEFLTHLESLDLTSTQIDDSAIETLARLSTIKELQLDFTNVTDQGMREIGNLTGLMTLSLDHTRISDTGLLHLKSLGNLYEISIRDTAITDEGLAELDKIPSLMVVKATGTKITAAGVAASKASASDRQVDISP